MHNVHCLDAGHSTQCQIFSTILATVRKIELDLQSERHVIVHSSLAFCYQNESNEFETVRIGQRVYFTGLTFESYFCCKICLVESCERLKYLSTRDCLTKTVMIELRPRSCDTHNVRHLFENIINVSEIVSYRSKSD